MPVLKFSRSARVGLVAVLTLAGCGGQQSTASGDAAPSGDAPQEVVIEGGTGLFADCLRTSYYDPFTEETGITVLEAPEDDGLVRPQLAVETGNFQVNVDFVSSPEQVQSQGEEILEPIDYSVVPQDEMLEGLALTHGVGVNPNALVVGYNEEFMPDGAQPAGIEDFFDLEAFPGKRGMFEFLESHTIALALLADGVPADELVPFDFDRAFAKLDTIKDEIVFMTSGTEARSLLDSGEAPLQITFASRIKESLDAGVAAGIGWDGFSLFSDFMVVPKGDPNKDLAMELIAFISRSDVSGNMSECVAIGPANAEAEVNPDVEPFLPTSHLEERHVVLTSPEFLEWTSENAEDIFNRFQEWRTN